MFDCNGDETDDIMVEVLYSNKSRRIDRFIAKRFGDVIVIVLRELSPMLASRQYRCTYERV